MITACKKQQEEIPETQAPASETEVNAPTVADEVGFEAEDNHGRIFRILTFNTQQSIEEHESDAEATGVVPKLIFERNAQVGEYVGVEIVASPAQAAKGDWKTRGEFLKVIKSEIQGNNRMYDMVSGISGLYTSLVSAAYNVNLAENAYIDLSKPWWVAGQYEELQIDGKLYMLYGDMSLSLYRNINAIYFNQGVLTDLSAEGLRSPYSLVKENRWTLESMLTMARAAGNDANGNDVFDTEDTVGLYGMKNPNRGFLTAFGLSIIDRNADGELSLIKSPSETYINAYQKLLDAYVNKNGDDFNYISGANDSERSAIDKVMTADRCLFMPGYVRWIEDSTLRGMKQSATEGYGLVVYPKLNDGQEAYYSPISTNASTCCILRNGVDADLSARVMTYMAYLGSRTVIPSYYENYLEGRLTASPEMSEMLTMLRKTAVITSSVAYSSATNGTSLLELFEVSDQKHYGEVLPADTAAILNANKSGIKIAYEGRMTGGLVDSFAKFLAGCRSGEVSAE